MFLPRTYFVQNPVYLLCLDPCLQGFVEDVPPQAEWDQYTTLDPGIVSSTYIFPFVQFRCNGTLERVTLPYSVRRQDSINWDPTISAEIAFFRPGAQGYTELTSGEVKVDLPGRALFRFRANDDPIVGTVSLDITLRIQELDILGLKLLSSYTAITPSFVEVKDHIPFLMRSQRSSPVLRKGTFIACQDCSYQVADFLVPVVSVEFLPVQSVQGAATTNSFPEGKRALAQSFNLCG